MAQKKAKKKVKIVDKWKKKRWYDIVAPKVIGGSSLGNTPVLEPEMLMGRCITANLGLLLRDNKKQSVNMTFEVDKVSEGQAQTKVKKYAMIPASIKRLVRRNHERIDDSFIVTSKDNVKIRFKPLYLTRNPCSNSVCTAIRLKSREVIDAYVKDNHFDTIIQDLLNKKLLKEIKNNIDKISPIKICELRVVERVTDNTETKKEIVIEEVDKEEIEEEKAEVKEVESKEDKKEEKKEDKKEAASDELISESAFEEIS